MKALPDFDNFRIRNGYPDLKVRYVGENEIARPVVGSISQMVPCLEVCHISHWGWSKPIQEGGNSIVLCNS